MHCTDCTILNLVNMISYILEGNMNWSLIALVLLLLNYISFFVIFENMNKEDINGSNPVVILMFSVIMTFFGFPILILAVLEWLFIKIRNLF